MTRTHASRSSGVHGGPASGTSARAADEVETGRHGVVRPGRLLGEGGQVAGLGVAPRPGARWSAASAAAPASPRARWRRARPPRRASGTGRGAWCGGSAARTPRRTAPPARWRPARRRATSTSGPTSKTCRSDQDDRPVPQVGAVGDLAQVARHGQGQQPCRLAGRGGVQAGDHRQRRDRRQQAAASRRVTSTSARADDDDAGQARARRGPGRGRCGIVTRRVSEASSTPAASW